MSSLRRAIGCGAGRLIAILLCLSQPIGQAAKLRDSVGGTDEENSEHDSSDDEDEPNGKIFAKNGRRPTVKRAPSRQTAQSQADSDVPNLTEAIQKLDIQQGVR